MQGEGKFRFPIPAQRANSYALSPFTWHAGSKASPLPLCRFHVHCCPHNQFIALRARVLRPHAHTPGHRARHGPPDVSRPRRAPPHPPGQWATFCLKKWPMTIAPFGRPLKDNRGPSSPKGHFSSGCQTRVRGTYCPPFRRGQTRRGVPPARDLRPSLNLRAWLRRSRPSAFTSVSHWHSSGQIVTSNFANLRWSTCRAFGQHVPQPRPTARIGVERRSY
jgi:hypothetical protein